MDIETLSTLRADSEHADIWKAVAGACQEGVAIRPVTAEVSRSLGETDAVGLNLSMQQGRFNHPGVSWSENDDEVTFEFTEEAIRHYLIGAGRIYPLSWSARSKFGGLPDVPEGFDWPVGSDDYFEFIAQFDLSELPDFRRRSDLPAVGMLASTTKVIICPWCGGTFRMCQLWRRSDGILERMGGNGGMYGAATPQTVSIRKPRLSPEFR